MAPLYSWEATFPGCEACCTPLGMPVWRCSQRSRSASTVDHPRSAECLEECLSLLQVRGVKALREPAVDFCQQLARVVALALLLPQPCQTRGGPQFQGLGLLVAGNVEGSLEAGFRFEPRPPTLPQ